MLGAQHFNNKQKNNRFTAYYQKFFIKTFHLYQVKKIRAETTSKYFFEKMLFYIYEINREF
jgi:hypothetical protein